MADMNARTGNGEDQTRDNTGPAGSAGSAETGLETPDADAAEQHTPAAEEEGHRSPSIDFLVDVNEADMADQERTVELDEDDYR